MNSSLRLNHLLGLFICTFNIPFSKILGASFLTTASLPSNITAISSKLYPLVSGKKNQTTKNRVALTAQKKKVIFPGYGCHSDQICKLADYQANM